MKMHIGASLTAEEANEINTALKKGENLCLITPETETGMMSISFDKPLTGFALPPDDMMKLAMSIIAACIPRVTDPDRCLREFMAALRLFQDRSNAPLQ